MIPNGHWPATVLPTLLHSDQRSALAEPNTPNGPWLAGTVVQENVVPSWMSTQFNVMLENAQPLVEMIPVDLLAHFRLEL